MSAHQRKWGNRHLLIGGQEGKLLCVNPSAWSVQEPQLQGESSLLGLEKKEEGVEEKTEETEPERSTETESERK